MFDFPGAPTVGDIVTCPDGSFRVWDGIKWKAAPSSGSGSAYPQPTSQFDAAATGTDQATSPSATAQYVVVATGNYEGGIRVNPIPPYWQRIVNSTGMPITVWPNPGQHFSDMADNQPFTMQDTQSGFFALAPDGLEIQVSS